MSETRRTTYERLVRDWARPIYGLSCRMLRRRADADDATQEVFLRLWERIDQYDASRPFQPWIYRVATRVILNRIRGEKTREEKESSAPLRSEAESIESTEDAVERREREAIVQQGLARLDAESRSLLAMHYYGGLTQEQVAEVLDVPRTTVQSRIGKALDSLRESLKGAGHLAVLPGLEHVMRASTPPPVPDALLSSLLHIGAPATAALAPLIGGVLVTKKLLIAAALLMAFGLAGGFAAGYVVHGTQITDVGPDAPSPAEYARVLDENRRLAARLAGASGRPALATAGNARPGASSSAGPDSLASAEGTAAAAADGAKGDAAAGAVDWSKFAALFAANADRILEMKGDDGDRMKPADKQMVMGLLSEYMRASTAAHALSQHPFYDERVLPGLVVAVFGDTLGLSNEKKDALTTTLKTLVTSQGKALDFERMGPVERFVARQKTAADVLAAVSAAAGSEGRARYEKLEPLAESMLAGDHAEVRLGWDGKSPASSIGERVLARWKESYGLDEKQTDTVRAIADRYAQDAIDVLRRRGIDKPDANVTDEASHAAGIEMMGLQAAAERAIDGLLTAEQRHNARSDPPTLVVVQPGSDEKVSSSSWGGI